MRDLPTIHPRKGTGTQYSTRIKQAVLGGRRIDEQAIIDTFPEYLDDEMNVELINRENVLSSSYQVENTYFVKVVTEKHLKAHGFLTWWRNLVFTVSRLPTPFESFETPHEMVEHEYHAAKQTHEAGGAITKPYAYTNLAGDEQKTALLFEYLPNSGKVEGEVKSLKAFEHVVKTVRRMHDNGFTHTSLPFHVMQTVPEGEPYITDPIGKTENTDQSLLLGIGFDISTLLARYTPHIGTLPALNILSEHYNDVELVAAYKTATPIQVTVPGTPGWVIKHLRSSIDEYADSDAVDAYLEIVGEQYDTTPAATTADSDETPYTTGEFVQAMIENRNENLDDEAVQQDTTNSQTRSSLSEGGDDSIRLGEVKHETPATEPAITNVTESTSQKESAAENLKSPESVTNNEIDNKNTDRNRVDSEQNTENKQLDSGPSDSIELATDQDDSTTQSDEDNSSFLDGLFNRG